MQWKKALFFLCITTAATTLRADYETLNIYGSIGAGFGAGGQHYTSRVISAGTITKETDHFYNYGTGLKLDLGCQYFMMENVALQAAFGYSAGVPNFKVTSETGTGINTGTVDTVFKRNIFGIKVSVVPRFEALDLIDVYAGVGLGFFWNSRRFEITDNDPQLGERKASGKIASFPTLGFTGQLGTDYPVNDKLTLFGELAFEQISFALNKSIVKESGIPAIPEGTTYYSKDDANPDNLAPVKVPGSSFQIRIGVRFAIQ